MNEVYLHPLTVGELLDKAFRIYRSRFAALIGIVAAVLIPESILRLVVILYLGGLSPYAALILQSTIHLLANVVLVVFISHVYLGKTISFGDSYLQGAKRYWSVFGANFIMGLAIFVPLLILAFVPCIGLIGGVILAVFLSTKWSLAMPAIIVENVGASDGLRRSWNLTEAFFWRVLGTSFAANLLTLLITMLPTYFAVYLFSLTDISQDIIQIINLLIEQVALLIALPFSQAVIVLIYYDLRVRKEGFDLQVLAEANAND